MQRKKIGEVTIVSVGQKFDAHTAERIEQELLELVSAGATRIVCNLAATDYLSSAGLRVIFAVGKTLMRQGGGLALSAPQPYVKSVLETVRLGQIFTIAASDEEAARAIA